MKLTFGFIASLVLASLSISSVVNAKDAKSVTKSTDYKQDYKEEAPPVEQTPAPVPVATPTDILIVVDDSQSMAMDHSPQNFRKFQQAVQALRGTDFRIAVTTLAQMQSRENYGLSEVEALPLNVEWQILESNLTEATMGGWDVFGVDRSRQYWLSHTSTDFAERVASTVVRLPLGHYARNMARYESLLHNDDRMGGDTRRAYYDLMPTFGSHFEAPFHTTEGALGHLKSTGLEFPRQGSNLAILYWTDEDADDALYADTLLNTAVETYGANSVRFYAIMVQPGDVNCYQEQSWKFMEPLNEADYGTNLARVAAATGGSTLSICSGDYSPIFRDIAR